MLGQIGKSIFEREDPELREEAEAARALEETQLDDAVRDGQDARGLQLSSGWKLIVRLLDKRYAEVQRDLQKLDPTDPKMALTYGIAQARLKELQKVADIVPEAIAQGELAMKRRKALLEQDKDENFSSRAGG